MCGIPIVWVLDSHLSSLDLRQELLNEAESQLETAKMSPGDEFHKQGKAIIGKILKENAISYRAIVGDNNLGEKMLQSNVLSHHYYTNEITLQSALMQRYCELHSASWEG